MGNHTIDPRRHGRIQPGGRQRIRNVPAGRKRDPHPRVCNQRRLDDQVVPGWGRLDPGRLYGVVIERAWGARIFAPRSAQCEPNFALRRFFYFIHIVLINSPPHEIQTQNNDGLLIIIFIQKNRRILFMQQAIKSSKKATRLPVRRAANALS
ncbi:hypothetical protein [Burkholderia lata]|uniref:hypothetical protein n=1 Tax=Burkholderia lata (strain ATCC 17760 / DSM 23089 / LMG 22485 / NCIMB 9086 / R18194 / 383) TaxID=482957 RepID=UPI001582A78B|nr:hypothetical protein [Burkholderia lata]